MKIFILLRTTVVLSVFSTNSADAQVGAKIFSSNSYVMNPCSKAVNHTILVRIKPAITFPITSKTRLVKYKQFPTIVNGIFTRPLFDFNHQDSEAGQGPIEKNNPYHIDLTTLALSGWIRVVVFLENPNVMKFYKDPVSEFDGIGYGDPADSQMFCREAVKQDDVRVFYFNDDHSNQGVAHGSFNIGVVSVKGGIGDDTPIIIDPKIKNDG